MELRAQVPPGFQPAVVANRRVVSSSILQDCAKRSRVGKERIGTSGTECCDILKRHRNGKIFNIMCLGSPTSLGLPEIILLDLLRAAPSPLAPDVVRSWQRMSLVVPVKPQGEDW
eukprot:6341534-Amphidinium_carterae.1